MLPLNWIVSTDHRSITISVASLLWLLHMQILPRCFDAILLPAKNSRFWCLRPQTTKVKALGSNVATDRFFDLCSAVETTQFVLENSIVSKETREEYNTLQVTKTFY